MQSIAEFDIYRLFASVIEMLVLFVLFSFATHFVHNFVLFWVTFASTVFHYFRLRSHTTHTAVARLLMHAAVCNALSWSIVLSVFFCYFLLFFSSSNKKKTQNTPFYNAADTDDHSEPDNYSGSGASTVTGIELSITTLWFAVLGAYLVNRDC